MHYLSTRGDDRDFSFADVLLTGLAGDGGLFVPAHWPSVSAEEISRMPGRPYADIAAEIISLFVGTDIPPDLVSEMCTEVYGRFGHEEVAPLVRTGPEDWVLELFHGPTLAFKDFAMQILGQLFEYVLRQQNKRLTIIGATSGDTGGAAIEALKGLDALDVFILHPEGKVSEVQRRMMTTVREKNIHNIAIEGSFDDCQRLVKQMFADEKFRRQVNMGAINSINWARIMAQTVYYFTSAAALGAPKTRISYIVPTGNFGDIFAGFAAGRMGLALDTLGIATNRNDILCRALASGSYEPHAVHQTISPSMDIQVSSNFERLLFEAGGRDAETISRLMDDLVYSGRFSVPEDMLNSIRAEFAAYSSDELETAAMIREIHDTRDYLVDPHTAIGLVAARKARAEGRITGPAVTLSTAHPAKFPDAVRAAAGVEPSLPPRYANLFEREESYTILPDDLQQVQAEVLSAL